MTKMNYNETTIKSLPLVAINISKLPDISTYIEEYNDETFYEKCNTLNEVHLKINTLKINQKNIFNAVLESWKQKQKNCVFIDGPGGSGKSYLLNILIDYLKFYDDHFYV